MVQHFFIVSRDHPWLYAYLMERFADDRNVQVILDRRLRERRVGALAAGMPQERRKNERRRPIPIEEDLGQRSHYIVER